MANHRIQSPLEEQLPRAVRWAHELPAELLADFIEQAGVPNAGIPFDFQPAVDARMVAGLTRDENCAS